MGPACWVSAPVTLLAAIADGLDQVALHHGPNLVPAFPRSLLLLGRAIVLECDRRCAAPEVVERRGRCASAARYFRPCCESKRACEDDSYQGRLKPLFKFDLIAECRSRAPFIRPARQMLQPPTETTLRLFRAAVNRLWSRPASPASWGKASLSPVPATPVPQPHSAYKSHPDQPTSILSGNRLHSAHSIVARRAGTGVCNRK